MSKKAPFFIIGVGRSGTSLLSFMMDAHSEIAIPFESHFIPKYFKAVGEYDLLKKSDRERLVQDILRERFLKRWEVKLTKDDIDLDRCKDLSGTIDAIFSAYAKKRGKKFWGDKTPTYTENMHIINRLFPDCRFVHIIRDGRDVALSLMNRGWGQSDFVTAIRFWREIVEWSRKMGAMLPQERYMEIRYEDLLENPEFVLKQVTRFLGFEYESTMVHEYTARARDKVPTSDLDAHKKLFELPDRSNAYKWIKRLSRLDQAIAYQEAGHVFEALNYPLGKTRAPTAHRVLRRGYWGLRKGLDWRLARLRGK